ncbi:transposable element Tc1 transposase [Caerostris extrusa]|uniref:Transposable element Tc1 transposase n=1 Tax=Caerostris extrusa TaxID=172846 RepID=A0AAV4Y7Y9_CAEEX|nr:transposable element Tc1 transposase [Caerostris extrusa]
MQMTISAGLRYVTDSEGIHRYPKSTVAYVIKKWKVSGDCRNVPRVGSPTKLEDRDRRVLTREIRKNRTQPMALIREEFQQASVRKHICMVFMVVLLPISHLNPIENLWDSLPRRIQGCTNRPKWVKELLCLLQAEWKKIPLAVIQRLVESMPRRVHAVIASRGGSTNY